MSDRGKIKRETSLVGVDSIECVDELVASAILLGASDVHLDISEYGASVFLRAGTRVSHWTSVSHDVVRSLVGRIKVLARLRLDVTDRSQDGAFSFRRERRGVESSAAADMRAYVRVSTAPTVFGENAVCRIFSNSLDLFDLERIGLPPHDLAALTDALHRDSGLVLVSGPTGSGKTTTLYACLRHLMGQSKVIVTLEDPVEVVIPGIRQIIVQHEHGFGFSNALRSVLRQDPDVIMVGEIRDRETAELAIQAALTGHLVLATIHAVSALGIIDRLNAMGIKSESYAQVVSLLVSQRKIGLREPHLSRVVFEIVDFNQKFKSTLAFASGAGSGSLAQTIRDEGIMLLRDRVESLFHEGLISRDEMNKYVR